MVKAVIQVKGMHCPKCDAKVESAVGAIQNIHSVKADHESDTVTIVYDGHPKTLDAARMKIVAQGFAVM